MILESWATLAKQPGQAIANVPQSQPPDRQEAVLNHPDGRAVRPLRGAVDDSAGRQGQLRRAPCAGPPGTGHDERPHLATFPLIGAIIFWTFRAP